MAVILSIIAFSLTALAEPKAYDLVKYLGRASDGTAIAFDFADGYPLASEIRITVAAAGQKKGTTKTFGLADSCQMRFLLKSNPSGDDNVVLKMSPDDDAPEKVEGVFYSAKTSTTPARTIAFTLTRR